MARQTMPNALFNAHPPCGGCPNARICEAQKLACEDFILFVQGEEFGVVVENRHPTEELFQKAMKM